MLLEKFTPSPWAAEKACSSPSSLDASPSSLASSGAFVSASFALGDIYLKTIYGCLWLKIVLRIAIRA
jgi:hypothetical protein